MLSYAQIFEDVFLERCFSEKQKGFFIDIGACHPVHCNSAYHFYEKGWSGINIEPTPFRFAELKRSRPRDVNINAAVGKQNGRVTFHVSANADHLSSLKPLATDIIDSHSAHVEQIDVEIMTLASLCRKHNVGTIDFLKIDVEGAEADVIAGADWNTYRPALIVIEAVEPRKATPAWGDWEPMLIQAGYDFVYFDGVNRYYTSKERSDLAQHFTTPINPFDGAVAFHGFGFPLDDKRHPDAEWARNFAERLFAASALDTPDHLLRVMTWDLLPGELNSPVTREGIVLAFNRVLARSPGVQDENHWIGRKDLPLQKLYEELLLGEEFCTRRARVSIRSMWR